MQLLVRSVITGFGMALGAAIFKKVQRQLGLGDPEEDKGKKPPIDPGEPGDGEPLDAPA